MPVRLLASDLDGTLLHSDSTVSVRTREALVAAEQAGLFIAFVTGRPPRWLHEIAEATGHTGVAVAANGAMLYDLHTETVVAQHLLDAEALDAVTAALRAEFPTVQFGVEYGLEFAYEPEYRHDWEITPLVDRHGRPMPTPVVGELAELITKPAIKLLAKDRGADPDEFLRVATAVIGARATLTRSGHSALLEIAAPGITKATGLAALGESLGISQADTAAVGDMPNDIPMLVWAGHSFAVANAHPDVREVAQVLPHTNDEDAVAQLIESFL
ncbi:MAG: Cof-type family hydrolase [Pseudonocardiales bacterium]|nr:Cof-type family hydrolase [Pseudonocardiales bacterium]